MAKDIKVRAFEIFVENLHMAQTNQTIFRRFVVDTIIAEYATPEKPMSLAASAAHYNTAKKLAESKGLVSGLGRPPKDPNEAKPEKSNGSRMPFDDEDCFTVLEIINGVVTRTGSYLDEALARKKLAERRSSKFPTTWKFIKGLGPNVGDVYKLTDLETDMEADDLPAQVPTPVVTVKHVEEREEEFA